MLEEVLKNKKKMRRVCKERKETLDLAFHVYVEQMIDIVY